MSSEVSVYTIWMKSLDLNVKGCTIFDSQAEIVYHVDNYDSKNSDKLYIIDVKGKTICKIVRKKLSLWGRWKAYRFNDLMVEEEKPWFKVQKASGILKSSASYATATVGCGTKNPICYKIEGLSHNSDYSIKDAAGGVAAEVKRKQTPPGIVLGEDIVTLTVQPNVDHLLMMGLVVVCSLINHQM